MQAQARARGRSEDGNEGGTRARCSDHQVARLSERGENRRPHSRARVVLEACLIIYRPDSISA